MIKAEEKRYDNITDKYIDKRLYLLKLYKNVTGKDYDSPVKPDLPNQPEYTREQPRPGTQARMVWDHLNSRGPMKVSHIAEDLHLSPMQVCQALRNYANRYFIKVSHGVWRAR